MACVGIHTSPDLPHVLLSQLLLHCSPVAILCFLHTVFHLLLCCLQCLLISAPEGSILPVEGSFDFPCHPWFVVRVIADSLGRGDHVCTEIKVICQTVCKALYFLTVWVDQLIPDCDVEQSLRASSISGDHRLKGRVAAGCLWTRGLNYGCSCIRLWSDFPRGGRDVALYASFTLAYNKSVVLLFLVGQSTTW